MKQILKQHKVYEAYERMDGMSCSQMCIFPILTDKKKNKTKHNARILNAFNFYE